MAIRKRGKGRWQVRVRPFPEVTVPTKEAAETVELDQRPDGVRRLGRDREHDGRF